MMLKDYYEILGVNQKASAEESSSSERTSTGESAPPSTSVIDLPTLIDMYFNKRIATVQARKFYDGFLATPRERHITWLKFIIVLLIIGLNLLLFNPSWGFLKDLLP